eukprot:5505781-Amphidinium_carterae.1
MEQLCKGCVDCSPSIVPLSLLASQPSSYPSGEDWNKNKRVLIGLASRPKSSTSSPSGGGLRYTRQDLNVLGYAIPKTCDR